MTHSRGNAYTKPLTESCEALGEQLRLLRKDADEFGKLDDVMQRQDTVDASNRYNAASTTRFELKVLGSIDELRKGKDVKATKVRNLAISCLNETNGTDGKTLQKAGADKHWVKPILQTHPAIVSKLETMKLRSRLDSE